VDFATDFVSFVIFPQILQRNVHIWKANSTRIFAVFSFDVKPVLRFH
jgi:hypothetical protein